jgi:predicted nucleotidyltransferase component of viral defense system
MEKAYKEQVALLLNVLPEVAKEKCFALHGGTAINLFFRDLPRLSVDIDLTYLHTDSREIFLKNIAEALLRIKSNIEKIIPGSRVTPRVESGKLQILSGSTNIKIEVNLVNRGVLANPLLMPLCENAQTIFQSFCVVPIVPRGQVFGGKIIAALDRQHPRDFFDIKYILETNAFDEEIKLGFLLCLLSSERPIHELINPNLLDQSSAHANQFAGMSNEEFSYHDFLKTRDWLIEIIQECFSEKDKIFLLGFMDVKPDWEIYDFQQFPAIAWKLQNLLKLKISNPQKHKEQYTMLESVLSQKK